MNIEVISSPSGPPTLHADEVALMARLAAGDSAALGTVHDLWCDAVYALAYAIVDDAEAAETIAEEAFFDLWTHAAAGARAQASPHAVLLAFARERAVTFVRAEKEGVPGDSCACPVIVCTSPAFAETLLHSSAAWSDTVRRAIRRLPPQQHRALQLACYGGATTLEIAQIMGVSVYIARDLMRDGLRALRSLLAP